jgi:hypothetical protein
VSTRQIGFLERLFLLGVVGGPTKSMDRDVYDLGIMYYIDNNVYILNEPARGVLLQQYLSLFTEDDKPIHSYRRNEQVLIFEKQLAKKILAGSFGFGVNQCSELGIQSKTTKHLEITVDQHVRFKLLENESFIGYPSMIRFQRTLFIPSPPNFPFIDKIYMDLSKNTVYFISDTIAPFSEQMKRGSKDEKGEFDDSIYEIEKFAHSKERYWDFTTDQLKKPKMTPEGITLNTMAAIYLDLNFGKIGHTGEIREITKESGKKEYDLVFYDPEMNVMDNIFYIYFSGTKEVDQKIVKISNVWYIEQGGIASDFGIMF